MKTKGAFFGREDLLSQLDGLWGKSVASLVTCRGRRRVGKSTLIEQFAARSSARFIKLEGLRPTDRMTNADQLAFFVTKLSAQTSCPKARPDDWYSAFVLLDRQIDDRRKTVVLLDEISWMACFDHTFPEVLKNAWDDLFRKHTRLVLVLCGSVSHWIRERIIDNRAYVGRRSLDVVVPELPLSECVKFWGKRAARTAVREIVDVLSVTGGVPRYLEEINPALSAQENIRRLCFLPRSVLREEFDDMFGDVITSNRRFSALVLRTFVDGPKSAAEVAERLRIARSGDITDALRLLSESGFIAEEGRRNPETGEPIRERRYRLKDNYTRFYLKFVEPNADAIDAGAFSFSTMTELPGLETVMGLAFENLVVNGYSALLPFLHMSGALVVSAGPFRRRAARGRRGRAGCQIDLMVQTRRAVWIIEVKRMNEIGRDIIDEVERKVRAIKVSSGVSVKTALVYLGDLSPVAATDGYFDALIPIERLLNLPLRHPYCS